MVVQIHTHSAHCLFVCYFSFPVYCAVIPQSYSFITLECISLKNGIQLHIPFNFINEIKIGTIVCNNFLPNINHSKPKTHFTNKAQCFRGHDPKAQEDVWRSSVAAYWEHSERLSRSGPHPSTLCKHLSDAQALQMSTTWNEYRPVIWIQVTSFSIQTAIIFVKQVSMSQSGSFRKKSVIIVPLMSFREEFNYSVFGEGWNFKMQCYKGTFRIFMLMDQ